MEMSAVVGAPTHRGTVGTLAVRATTESDAAPHEFIPYMIDLHVDSCFPFDKLVTTCPLADIIRAVDEQHAERCIKPVLLP